MQQGQPSVLSAGSAGQYAFSQALLLQPQSGQAGQGIMAPGLAFVPGGPRPIGAALAAAAAGGAAAYRAAGPHVSMSALLKAPARKAGAGSQQKGRKHCNCKNSRCLKLYCECFASGRYCDNCNCVTCYNNKENESVRQSAVEAILERNPNAFRPKIQTAEGDTHPQSIRNAPDGSVRHTKGCNCKKSSCLKKYCECFQGGIFCTEICKCVDCKNYDGSEARAQVLSIQEPYNHQLHQVAAQHALKRPRINITPPLLQQPGTSSGLLQAQSAAFQQLAAAAAGSQAAAAALPMQQLQSLAAVPPFQQQPAALPGPQRHLLLDVVHELVKPSVVEELSQLLILVAQEEADKQQQPAASSADEKPFAVSSKAHSADGSICNGVQQSERSAASTGQQHAVVKEEQTADGDAVMHEADLTSQEQQQQLQQQLAADGQQDSAAVEGLSPLYISQEAAVLQEFNAILQRIVAQAGKKASSMVGASAAITANTGPAATGAVELAPSSAALQAGNSAEVQPAAVELAESLGSQALLGSMPDGVSEAYTQQQSKHMAQIVQQQRQAALALPQQTAQEQQRAMVLQAAANQNLALAQLQANRQAAFLQGAAGGQQQQFAAGGLGMQFLPGLRPLGFGMPMQQMVQVLAQDGSVHQIPASSLMQFQLAAAAAAQPAMALQQPPAVLQQAAQLGRAQPAAQAQSSGAQANPLGVSLLSLLNGFTNNAGAGGSA